METTQPVIRIEKLAKVYHCGSEAVAAPRDIDLQSVQGELCAVMGPSGFGKSTLMDLLGCLDQPTPGSYSLLDRDVAKKSRDKLAAMRLHSIGCVFQGFNLLPRTSAVEDVELPLSYAGANSEERRERALAALERVGLRGHADHSPVWRSGGQPQRVAVARALVKRPALLLAYEPKGNLDSKTSLEVITPWQALIREGLMVICGVRQPPACQQGRQAARG